MYSSVFLAKNVPTFFLLVVMTICQVNLGDDRIPEFSKVGHGAKLS